jgi:hypothetical protein
MQEGVLYLQYYSSYAAVNYSGLFYTAVPGAKCPWGELSWGELSWGELSWGEWSGNQAVHCHPGSINLLWSSRRVLKGLSSEIGLADSGIIQQVSLKGRGAEICI